MSLHLCCLKFHSDFYNIYMIFVFCPFWVFDLLVGLCRMDRLIDGSIKSDRKTFRSSHCRRRRNAHIWIYSYICAQRKRELLVFVVLLCFSLSGFLLLYICFKNRKSKPNTTGRAGQDGQRKFLFFYCGWTTM